MEILIEDVSKNVNYIGNGYIDLEGEYILNNKQEFHDKYFTREELKERFKVFEGEKTLGEIDVKDVFHKQKPAKGIGGCVIEQSVLDMKQNSLQEADLEILQSNGEYKSTELKVTGVKLSNKKGKKYEAKEPMSLTAVSIGTIENETFLKSHFYEKIAHMIWIFYYYDRTIKINGTEITQKVVPYAEYERFPILGYTFLDIANDEEELKKFENDWKLVQQYIINANKADNPKELYPLLHSSIKDKLFYIDIAPRYKKVPKQTPRFRLKKSYVDAIFQEFYQSKKNKKIRLERLPENINSYEELEDKLHQLTKMYRGKTVEELVEIFGIKIQYFSVAGTQNENKVVQNIIPKQIGERIAVNMLGGSSEKITNIELFNKIGVVGKSVVITKQGKHTQDMKLFTLDLDEIRNINLEFEDTSCFQYFNEYKILCILYEEPSKDAPLNDNKFLGFKWFKFNDKFINDTIREVYEITCDRINNHTLVESYKYKKDGTQQINKTGVPITKLNLPKSSEYNIFIKGTGGSNSKNKTWVFEGHAADGTNIIHTYSQQVWLKGSYLTESLKNIDFI